MSRTNADIVFQGHKSVWLRASPATLGKRFFATLELPKLACKVWKSVVNWGFSFGSLHLAKKALRLFEPGRWSRKFLLTAPSPLWQRRVHSYNLWPFVLLARISNTWYVYLHLFKYEIIVEEIVTIQIVE